LDSDRPYPSDVDFIQHNVNEGIDVSIVMNKILTLRGI
jgi:hypothetical protein